MDPWGEIRERDHLVYISAAIKEDGRYYHGSRAIILRAGLGQAARRSALAHELVHAEHADVACCSPWHEQKQERQVSEEAARRLIAIDDLVDKLLWTLDEQELAEDLWVDVATVRARLRGLTPGEKDDIDRRIRAAEGRMP